MSLTSLISVFLERLFKISEAAKYVGENYIKTLPSGEVILGMSAGMSEKFRRF